MWRESITRRQARAAVTLRSLEVTDVFEATMYMYMKKCMGGGGWRGVSVGKRPPKRLRSTHCGSDRHY